MKEKIPAKGFTLVLVGWIVMFMTGFGMIGIGTFIPDMRAQFGISVETAGLFSTVTLFGQVLLGIPLATLFARVNPRYSMGFVLLCTTAAFLCHAIANGAAIIFVGRALIAVGLAGCAGPLALVKNSWIPLSRVTEINGFEQFVSTGGQWIGTMGTALLISLVGHWQNVMWVMTGIGVIGTVLWFIMYKENPENPVQLSKGGSILAPLKEAASKKEIWLLAIGWPGTTLVWIATTTYFPTYATETLGWSLGQAGTAVGMIPLFSMLGCITAPYLAKALKSDKLMLWPWGLVLTAAYFGGVYFESYPLVCVCYAIAGYGAFAFVPTGISTAFKIGLPSGSVGIGISIITTCANIGGTLAGMVPGWLLNSGMSLQTAIRWCCLSPLLWFACTIFMPETGERGKKKAAAAE